MDIRAVLLSIVVVGILPGISHAQQSKLKNEEKKFSSDERALIATSKTFSQSTTADGGGWKDYDSFLHEKFSRWSNGQSVMDRKKTSEMIKEWAEAGNLMKIVESKLISIQLVGNTGVLRKRIREQYLDAKNLATGKFSGFVTQVWLKENDEWKLLSATIERSSE